jgi:hypothetical protein
MTAVTGHINDGKVGLSLPGFMSKRPSVRSGTKPDVGHQASKFVDSSSHERNRIIAVVGGGYSVPAFLQYVLCCSENERLVVYEEDEDQPSMCRLGQVESSRPFGKVTRRDRYEEGEGPFRVSWLSAGARSVSQPRDA